MPCADGYTSQQGSTACIPAPALIDSATYGAEYTPSPYDICTRPNEDSMFSHWEVSDSTDIRYPGDAFDYNYPSGKNFTAVFVPDGFKIVTVPLNPGTIFTFRMSAMGTFWVDWGDGYVQKIVKDDTSEQTYSHKFTKSYPDGVIIRYRGNSSLYNSDNTVPVISFYETTNNSHLLVKKAIGDIGTVFPTLGQAKGQQPIFYQTFTNCRNLESVTDNLFNGINGSADGMFAFTFTNCESLKSIAGTLFNNISGAGKYMFQSTFYGCKSLKSIPAGLFKNITGGESNMFISTFQGCSGLGSDASIAEPIPEDLFSNITEPAIAMFSGTFSNCINLDHIPSGLFATITQPAENMFISTFSGCSGLKRLPEGLFSNITSPQRGMFTKTFMGCNGFEPNTFVPPSLFSGLISHGSPYSTYMMDQVFYNTNLMELCPESEGMMQYVTGYEGFWTRKVSCVYSYPIEYNMNGGINYEEAPTTYGAGVGASISGVPTKTGFEFAGWCTDETLTECALPQVVSESDSGTKTFWAKWNVISSVVTLDSNSGVVPDDGTTSVEVDYDSAMPAINVDALPTRDGYTFEGYYDTPISQGGIQYYDRNGESLRSWYGTYDAVLYARWAQCNLPCDIDGATCTSYVANNACLRRVVCNEGFNYKINAQTLVETCEPKVYTIEYELNGGNDITSATQYAYGTETVIDVVPVKPGYRFVGWCDNEDLEDCELQKTISATDTGNKKFWASWDSINYKVTFNGNRGTIPVGGVHDIVVTYGQELEDIPASQLPTREGYVFEGYYTVGNDAYVTEYYNRDGIAQRPWEETVNTMLYAKWARCPECSVENATCTVSVVDNQCVVTSECSGGYTAVQEGNGFKCEAEKYSVEYEFNGGEYAGNGLVYEYTYGTDMVIYAMPTKSGYDFGGWCTDATLTDCALPQKINKTDTGDKKFWAKWIDNTTTYTITLLDDNLSVVSEISGVRPNATLGNLTRGQMAIVPGYVFEGYYGADNKQYFDGTGVAVSAWTNTSDTVLYAKLRECGSGYYCTAEGVRSKCPTGETTIGAGAGADESGDCGRVMYIDGHEIYLRKDRKTANTLNVKYSDGTYYANASESPTSVSYCDKGKLRVKQGDKEYYIYDESGAEYTSQGSPVCQDISAPAVQ